MNVAIHLTYNGYSPVVISRTGNDALGIELRGYLQQKNISTQYIQTDAHYPTGIVQANVSQKNEVTYDIVEPVAWDFIQYEEAIKALVRQSDVFVFGSLAARNTTSQDTLTKYLQAATFKVLDVNLRPPHYTPKRTEMLLREANLVKMNHLELAEIIGWYQHKMPEKQAMQYVREKFDWELIIVTRGENGAAILTKEGYYEHSGFQVEVEDTIGSGDAFLATFLTNYIQQESIDLALERACRIGAFVATQKGATPFYVPGEVALS